MATWFFSRNKPSIRNFQSSSTQSSGTISRTLTLDQPDSELGERLRTPMTTRAEIMNAMPKRPFQLEIAEQPEKFDVPLTTSATSATSATTVMIKPTAIPSDSQCKVGSSSVTPSAVVFKQYTPLLAGPWQPHKKPTTAKLKLKRPAKFEKYEKDINRVKQIVQYEQFDFSDFGIERVEQFDFSDFGIARALQFAKIGKKIEDIGGRVTALQAAAIPNRIEDIGLATILQNLSELTRTSDRLARMLNPLQKPQPVELSPPTTASNITHVRLSTSEFSQFLQSISLFSNPNQSLQPQPLRIIKIPQPSTHRGDRIQQIVNILNSLPSPSDIPAVTLEPTKDEEYGKLVDTRLQKYMTERALVDRTHWEKNRDEFRAFKKKLEHALGYSKEKIEDIDTQLEGIQTPYTQNIIEHSIRASIVAFQMIIQVSDIPDYIPIEQRICDFKIFCKFESTYIHIVQIARLRINHSTEEYRKLQKGPEFSTLPRTIKDLIGQDTQARTELMKAIQEFCEKEVMRFRTRYHAYAPKELDLKGEHTDPVDHPTWGKTNDEYWGYIKRFVKEKQAAIEALKNERFSMGDQISVKVELLDSNPREFEFFKWTSFLHHENYKSRDAWRVIKICQFEQMIQFEFEDRRARIALIGDSIPPGELSPKQIEHLKPFIQKSVTPAPMELTSHEQAKKADLRIARAKQEAERALRQEAKASSEAAQTSADCKAEVDEKESSEKAAFATAIRERASFLNARELELFRDILQAETKITVESESFRRLMQHLGLPVTIGGRTASNTMKVHIGADVVTIHTIHGRDSAGCLDPESVARMKVAFKKYGIDKTSVPESRSSTSTMVAGAHASDTTTVGAAAKKSAPKK